MGFKRGRSRSRSSSSSRKRTRTNKDVFAKIRSKVRSSSRSSSGRRYRRRSGGNVKVEGSGGQISYTARSNSYATPAAKIIMKAASANYWYNNYATRLEAGVGKAAVISTTLCGGGNFSAVTTFDNDLAAIQNNVEGSQTGPYRTFRYLVEQATHDFRMTNQDNGNVEIHIWDLAVKRDTNTAPVAAFVNGLNDMISGGGSLTQTTLPPGVFPQQSALFNAYYKVMKHSRIILGQGQSHSHYVKMRPKRMFNSELLTEGNISLKGFTVHTLIQVIGMPQNDSTTKTQVSLGGAAVDIAVTKTIKYRWSDDDKNNAVFNLSIPQSFTVGESVMNIGTGTVTTQTQA